MYGSHDCVCVLLLTEYTGHQLAARPLGRAVALDVTVTLDGALLEGEDCSWRASCPGGGGRGAAGQAGG